MEWGFASVELWTLRLSFKINGPDGLPQERDPFVQFSPGLSLIRVTNAGGTGQFLNQPAPHHHVMAGIVPQVGNRPHRARSLRILQHLLDGQDFAPKIARQLVVRGDGRLQPVALRSIQSETMGIGKHQDHAGDGEQFEQIWSHG